MMWMRREIRHAALLAGRRVLLQDLPVHPRWRRHGHLQPGDEVKRMLSNQCMAGNGQIDFVPCCLPSILLRVEN